MQRTFAQDYQFGINKEYAIIDILRKLNPDIHKTANVYCGYDFESPTARIEHKSRTNKYNAYSTTLMPVSKSLHIIDNKKLFFTFGFTDGIYYIEYTPENFADIEVKPFKRHQRADYNDREQPYFFIPIERLTLLH